MNAPAAHKPTTAAAAGHQHASTAIYLIVAGILSGVTGLEFGVIYVRRLAPVLLPILLTLSAGKFALVVMFYMHLRYDSRVLTLLFVAPLVLAICLAVAVTTLTGAFLVYGR